jgi:hypothetical protein
MLAWAAGEGRPLLGITPGPAAPQGLLRRVFAWMRERM